MSKLVVSRQVDAATDRGGFVFVGFATDCDLVSAVADEHGCIVIDSGAMRDGAWIELAKSADQASPFPDLYTAVERIKVNGRIASEVVN